MTDLNKPLTKPKSTKKAAPVTAVQFSYSRTITTILAAGLVIATLFTMWSPNRLSADNLLNDLMQAVQEGEAPQLEAVATSDVQKPRIGIVAGHTGYDAGYGEDPGAVCEYGQYEGTTEREVNLRVATIVRNQLQQMGYEVDLLEEFDDRLQGYQADALVSIHADSCQYINDSATGFKLAAALSNPYPEKTNRLQACLIHHYGQSTNLPYHIGSARSYDMAEYHTFREVNPDTPTVIIETGFMNLDADIIIRQPQIVASGIADGILCYVRNETLPEDTLATAQPQ